jgi:WD40 repeat protein
MSDAGAPGEPGEALLDDQSRRWRQGQGLAVEEYLRRQPALQDDPELLLDLIYHEIALRERAGDQPRFDEYRSRFPNLAGPLQALFEIHQLAARPPSPSQAGPVHAGAGLAETLEQAQRTGSSQAAGEADAAVWYYARGREKVGPFTREQLRQMAADGTLSPDAMIWQQDTPRWLPARSVPGLFDAAATPPSPAGRQAADLPAVRGYEVLGVLGKGGMGVVYKARQLGLNRTVALKMILSGALAGPDALERFRREAEAVARLQHPHIVAVHEIGTHGGLPFFSLEFVAGGSLDKKLAHTPQPPREAAGLGETLARALHAAHHKGVVHRDLKPANVLLAEDGTPKVTDFGLAKQLDDDSGRTREGDVMGTPSYMAPEQASGDLRRIGPATDVYALGAILYECLTGRPPFRGATLLETLEQVRHREPVPPRLLLPKLPRDLETVCLKCLQKEPARRYATALGLADDLRRFLDGRPILARPVGAWERAVKWAKRRPAVAFLIALVVVVAAAGLAGILWKWREAVTAQGQEAFQKAAALKALGEKEEALGKEKAANEAAQKAKTKAETAEQETKRKNEQLERQAYAASIAGAARALAANDVVLARDHLRACKPALRHWEWNYLWRQCEAHLFAVAGNRSVAYSPDGKRLITIYGGAVRFYDADTGREAGSLAVPPVVALVLTFSPDGKRLARAEGMAKQVQVRDLATGKVVRTFGDFKGEVQAIAFGPDGSRLAIAAAGPSGPGEVKVVDVGTGQTVLDLAEVSGPVESVCLSPDGKRLALAAADRTVRLRDAADGKELRVFQGHEGAVKAVAFSPDGRHLASAGTDTTVRLWDVTGDRHFVCRGHAQPVTAIAWSPDGWRVASAGSDKSVRVWDRQGQEVAAYLGHGRSVAGVAFSPDGSRLASADEWELRVWDATTPPASLPPGKCPGARAVAFSGDGRWLAAGTSPGVVWVRDRGTGRVLWASPQRPLLRVTGLAFRPGGQELASGDVRGAVIVRDAATGRPLRTFSFKAEVGGLAYSPDGARLAVRTGDSVRVLDAATGEELLSWPSYESASGLAFSPDGRHLALTGDSKHSQLVQIVDVATRRRAALLQGHTRSIYDLAWQGDQLATLSLDGTVKVWDVSNCRDPVPVRFNVQVEPAAVGSLAFSPDGRRLVALTDRECKVWELVEGKELLSLPGGGQGAPAVAFSPDGRCLAGSGLRGAEILDGGAGPQLFSLRPRNASPGLSAIAWAPDGRLLARGSSAQVALWDAVTGEELPPLPAAPARVLGLAFSPDGRFLAAAGGDLAAPLTPGEVTVWDVDREGKTTAEKETPGRLRFRKEARSFREHTTPVVAVAFAPAGVAGARGGRVASSSYDGTIKIWDAATGKVEHTLRGQGPNVTGLRFSPDGTRLASCGNGKVWVWDTAAGRQLYACGRGEARTFFRDAVFSPDGKYLVTADDSAVRVWDAATGAEASTGRGLGNVGALAALSFSADGKYLAGTCLLRGEVVVCDFATGAAVLTYHTATNELTSLAFCPEGRSPGRRLAVNRDEAVDVWDVDERWQAAEAQRRRQERPWLIAWHREQARVVPDWSAIRFHRSRLIDLEPQEGLHYLGRADADAELGSWAGAAADLARAIELRPDDPLAWDRQALLSLRAGETAAYRQTCARLLERYGQSKDPDVSNALARLCVIAPDATGDLKRVVGLAESAVAAESNGARLGMHDQHYLQNLRYLVAAESNSARLGTLGAALYRAGQAEQAVTRLREAIKVHVADGTAQNWLFLALAYHGAGKPDEARQSLEHALKAEKEPFTWQDRLERDLLRAEAEALLKDKK